MNARLASQQARIVSSVRLSLVISQGGSWIFVNCLDSKNDAKILSNDFTVSLAARVL